MLRVFLPLSLILLLASSARAEDTDLGQTISDLGGQTTDKEKMDSLGATRVELSQIRTWLNDATNAVKEEAQKKGRGLFDLIRAQLKLVDQLIALSKIEDEAGKIEKQVADGKQKAAASKRELEEKQAKLRALKMKESE